MIESDKEPAEVRRNAKGHFLPGYAVANPKGRIPLSEGGTPNSAVALRHYIDTKATEILDTMIAAAIAGDIQAADKLMQFILPKLQAVGIEINDRDSLPIMNIITAIQNTTTIDITPEKDNDGKERTKDEE